MKFAPIFAAALLFAAATAPAQTKIASIDMETVILSHPKAEANKTELTSLQKEYEDILDIQRNAIKNRIAELEAKFKDVNNEALSESVRKDTLAEVRTLENTLRSRETELRNFSAELQRKLRLKELELFDVVISDIKDAVNKTAKADGYDYVLDNSVHRASAPVPIVMFSNIKFDITDKVIAAIGGKKIDKNAITNKAAE